MFDIGNVPEFQIYELKDSDWRDGLVVRSPNWLGDAVMTLPAIVQFKKIVPKNCGLFVISPPGLKDLYASIPLIDRVIVLDKAHKNWTKKDMQHVKRSQAGVAVLFNNSPRDVIYLRLAGVKKMFGASARFRGLLMTQAYKYPKRVTSELNEFQHSAKYLSMAYALGAPKWSGELPEFVIDKAPEQMKPELIELLKKDNILSIAPGAAYGPAKCWPAENFRDISEYWIKRGGIVVSHGTGKDKKAGDEILKGLSEGQAINLAGETDLKELMKVLEKSAMCVANDSGIMHLSAALGSKGVAIFGSTDPTATAPVSSKWRLMFEKQFCAPCFKRICPRGSYNCLKAVKPVMVKDAIEELLTD